MNVKRLLTVPALLLASSAILAGYTQPAPVTIDLDLGFAGGDMITARNIDDDVTFIGCGQRQFDDGAGGAFSTGFCQAQVEEASAVTCFTQNAALLDGIDSVADASYITFSWTDDGEGNLTCTRIGSSTQSFYLEKGKKITAEDLEEGSE